MSNLSLDSANRLRDNGLTDQALEAYQAVATAATSADDIPLQAEALHLAGVAATAAISQPTSHYYTLAVQFFAQAEALFQRQKDNKSLGNLYRDWAIASDNAHQFEAAKTYFDRAMALQELTGTPAEQAVTHAKLANHYAQTRQVELAAPLFQQALLLARQQPEAGFGYATILRDYAWFLTKTKQYESAKEIAQESLSWFAADHGQDQYWQRQAELNGLLTVIYTQLNQTTMAKKHGERFTTFRRRLDPNATTRLDRWLEAALN